MISIMSDWVQIFDDAPVRELAKGEVLFRRSDPVRAMFFVRSGAVALERPLTDGGLLTLHLSGPGAALAEASLFAETYHCDAVARLDSSVAAISQAEFKSALRRRPDAAMSMIESHAKALQAQRARIEVMRLRRVSDRLDAWLDIYDEPPKGGWITVADQIGVSPPALYRELAKRR